MDTEAGPPLMLVISAHFRPISARQSREYKVVLMSQDLVRIQRRQTRYDACADEVSVAKLVTG